jgi:REP element-mobilizing transposase RayT
MGAKHRLEIADGLYHVWSRGNARDEVFRDEVDYVTFLRVLAPLVRQFKWLCHSFCLMPNHFHLLLETPEPNLARGMRLVKGTYAQRFNGRHRRAGHVFQGPASCLHETNTSSRCAATSR